MNTKDYFELFRYLMEQYCLFQEDIVFVDDIPEWCRQNGIPETDADRPLKLVLKTPSGCKMLIRETVPDEVINERLNAFRIRGQIKNVAFDRADMLNSDQKKLAYLFLSEYATSLPDVGDDELLADDWAFTEMERLGYFKK
jgi:hypothetical protein